MSTFLFYLIFSKKNGITDTITNTMKLPVTSDSFFDVLIENFMEKLNKNVRVKYFKYIGFFTFCKCLYFNVTPFTKEYIK